MFHQVEEKSDKTAELKKNLYDFLNSEPTLFIQDQFINERSDLKFKLDANSLSLEEFQKWDDLLQLRKDLRNASQLYNDLEDAKTKPKKSNKKNQVTNPTCKELAQFLLQDHSNEELHSKRLEWDHAIDQLKAELEFEKFVQDRLNYFSKHRAQSGIKQKEKEFLLKIENFHKRNPSANAEVLRQFQRSLERIYNTLRQPMELERKKVKELKKDMNANELAEIVKLYERMNTYGLKNACPNFTKWFENWATLQLRMLDLKSRNIGVADRDDHYFEKKVLLTQIMHLIDLYNQLINQELGSDRLMQKRIFLEKATEEVEESKDKVQFVESQLVNSNKRKEQFLEEVEAFFDPKKSHLSFHKINENLSRAIANLEEEITHPECLQGRMSNLVTALCNYSFLTKRVPIPIPSVSPSSLLASEQPQFSKKS